MEIDNKIAASVVGAIATAGTVLARLLYKAIGHRISQAEQTAANAVGIANKVEERRRDDSIAIHKKIDEHVSRASIVHEKILEKLAAIPTRDEVYKIVRDRE